ncbi:glycosyltransferase family 2 protein [Spiribacter pallidus]|uniref:Glycosyltransferase n=1 Tax=Spiribacter pallidus TaxID=1987936 RepID=A0ABV3TCQ8_9GAMM
MTFGLVYRSNRLTGVILGFFRRRLSVRDFSHSTGIAWTSGRVAETIEPGANLRSVVRLKPGDYWLRLHIETHSRELDGIHGNARIYKTTDRGDEPDTAMGLPYRSGEVAERRLRLERPARLRIDPVEFVGPFRIKALSVEKLPTTNLDWWSYNGQFERRPDECLSYARWIAEVEPRLIAGWVVASGLPLPRSAGCPCTFRCRVGSREDLLQRTLESLRQQTHGPWEFVVFGSSTGLEKVGKYLGLGEGRDHRIRLINEKDAERTGENGEWSMDLCPGDRLHPEALACLERTVADRPELKVIYCDHDQMDENGFRHDPRLKPDWSPVRYDHGDYIDRSRFVRSGFAIDQSMPADEIAHIPLVLFHKSPASSQEPTVSVIPEPKQEKPTVSLVIPTKDGGKHLKRLLEGLSGSVSADSTEVILVDNQTSDEESLESLHQLRQKGHVPGSHLQVSILSFNEPFNFAAMINLGVHHARNEVIGLLNDDIEPPEERDWLGHLSVPCAWRNVGCVGPLLTYPNGSIQHAGIALGLGGVAGHPMRGLDPRRTEAAGMLGGVGEVSAVTGAALFTRKTAYDAVGGMDESLSVAYNDVDLCLKMMSHGFSNLLVPGVRLKHHESLSRGSDVSGRKAERLAEESRIMRARWSEKLNTDPFYNANLSRAREDLALADHGLHTGGAPDG